jgi:hypothetical protein
MEKITNEFYNLYFSTNINVIKSRNMRRQDGYSSPREGNEKCIKVMKEGDHIVKLRTGI